MLNYVLELSAKHCHYGNQWNIGVGMILGKEKNSLKAIP